MTAPSNLGGWAPDLSTAGSEWANATSAQRDDAIAAAVRTVWALSGRQFGTAGVVVAPWVPYTPPSVYRGYGRPHVSPYLVTRFDRARRILLPGPVVDVAEVRIGDVVLVRGEQWALEGTGHLVRREGVWPCQDLNWPTFLVTYTRGTTVPREANVAAGALAEQLLKARIGSKACTLPTRTREIARQGLTYTVGTPDELSDKGLTGLKVVDDFVVSVNPTRQTAPATVWSPELSSHRVLTP